MAHIESSTKSESFFSHLCQYQDKHGNGQKWNAICEDAATLLFDYFIRITEIPIETIWEFLYAKPVSFNTHYKHYKQIYDICRIIS